MSMMTIVETAEAIRSRRMSAREAVAQAFERIGDRNPSLNAFVALDEAGAYAAAALIDEKSARGEDPGPLAGVPFGVKDIENLSGLRTTQGSWFLRDTPAATADSLHVARLRAAGAIPVGKTATAEFGMDSATHTTLFGTTRNPWNLACTPGGSSGGSSAAVAGGLVPLATGTDAAGSIRQPGAFTGLVGLKPSHGRIAKENGFSNWSVRGGFARTVADLARYHHFAFGPDDRDRQSLPDPGWDLERSVETLDVGGLRAVWSPDYGYAVVEPEVEAIALAAAERLIADARLTRVSRKVDLTNAYVHLGAVQLVNLESDFTAKGILPDGYSMLSPMVRHFLDLIREQRDRIDLDLSWAMIRRLEQDVAALFGEVDLLLSPAAACRPYAADSIIPDRIDGRDARESGVEPFGPIANVCWNPAISIPAGMTSDGLPVGLQIVARRHRDDVLLRLARIAEQAWNWPLPPGFA